MTEPQLIFNRAGDNAPLLVLAHGAGAPMDSVFMEQITTELVALQVSVARFEFPYMRQRREGGSKRPPDRQPVLIDTWRQVLQQFDATGEGDVFIGGKSMGGRMAAITSAEQKVKGVICFGYPFHPPAKLEKLRLEPLAQSPCPLLIVQGTRDKLGSRDDAASYSLPQHLQIEWLEDGDHDLKPRVKSGFTHAQHIHTAANKAARFIHSIHAGETL
ncbi:alpha/beta family hydrolase [Gilvimarinus xylanilyticus]|uniref:Dienelactone hydrolase family protein n=1 Tax=Gilvimarinus xylanilyticus TaxID=2944139 RepID=A0A9X2HY19_9GAMM|nr:alpha/beta family hydrolase [Gilvimarinus xylanilyticus]MCP8899169.1 dienelactone hydrolase family protein [Gilvimarinus xylanilyticus]